MQKKIYFASDFHLGIENSKEREQKIVDWLTEISSDASHIYLVGDVFDFWFEYKYVVPKGYIKFLSKLHDLVDQGIEIAIFSGNHDIWYKDYFQTEFGIPVYHEPIQVEHFGKQIEIGHGDGLGPGDHGYKFLKSVLRNPVATYLFGLLPTDWAYGLANYFSGKSRLHTSVEEFLGPEKEWLIQYCEDQIKNGNAMDYFIFGHRHLPIRHKLSNGTSEYINLGDWIEYDSFAVLDSESLELITLRNEMVDTSV